MDTKFEQIQTACAFAQFGAVEEVTVKTGGWAEELTAYATLAEQFEKEHTQKAQDFEEDYWDSLGIDYYEALEIFWSQYKGIYFFITDEVEAAS